jgi:uncharacterized protein YbbK (DUF523 family)
MTEHESKPASSETVLVSACLLGVCCRFDGGSQPNPGVLARICGRRFVPVCPEQLGGLPTPRPRHEIVGDRVISEHGIDATGAFERGANEALRLMELSGARLAILKARSPSCGRGQVYDGTFSGRLVPGDGVFARRLVENGYEVRTEDDFGRTQE